MHSFVVSYVMHTHVSKVQIRYIQLQIITDGRLRQCVGGNVFIVCAGGPACIIRCILYTETSFTYPVVMYSSHNHLSYHHHCLNP